MTSFARLSPFAVDSQTAAKGDIVIGRGVAVAVVGCAVARASIWAGTQSDLVEPLATVTLGQRPFAVAGDDRAGRALIVDDLDNTISVLDTRRGHLVRTSMCVYAACARVYKPSPSMPGSARRM